MSRGIPGERAYVEHAFGTSRLVPKNDASMQATEVRSSRGSLFDSSPLNATNERITANRPQSGYHTARSTYQSSFKPAPAAGSMAAEGPQPTRVLVGYQGKMTSRLSSLIKANTSSKAELGRATWTYLHQTAAQLPDQPSMDQQQDARQMVELLATSYPCPECAGHFREIIRRDPPMVSTGLEFQRWMCRAHNTVNRAMGKPIVNCDLISRSGASPDAGAMQQRPGSALRQRGAAPMTGATWSFQDHTMAARETNLAPFMSYTQQGFAQPVGGRRRVGRCNCR